MQQVLVANGHQDEKGQQHLNTGPTQGPLVQDLQGDYVHAAPRDC